MSQGFWSQSSFSMQLQQEWCENMKPWAHDGLFGFRTLINSGFFFVGESADLSVCLSVSLYLSIHRSIDWSLTPFEDKEGKTNMYVHILWQQQEGKKRYQRGREEWGNEKVITNHSHNREEQNIQSMFLQILQICQFSKKNSSMKRTQEISQNFLKHPIISTFSKKKIMSQMTLCSISS